MSLPDGTLTFHMKQIWITKSGSPEVLKIREADDPEPGEDTVVVDVCASGVNFADVLARNGMYPDAPPIPCVVGYEISGVVREVGARVGTFEKNDRVLGLTRFGGYSTVVSVPASQLYKMPDSMDFTTAAAIPVNYITAYLAIVRFGNVQPDERVLIHNAGGGVGIAAIQLAKRMSAHVYGTASAWKHEKLRSIGADELIDYRSEDFVDAVRRLVDTGDMHLIVDPVGGSQLKRDIEVLAPLGRLVAYGFSEPVRSGKRSILRTLRSVLSMPRPHFLKLLSRNWSVAGLNLGHLWSEVGRLRIIGEELIAAWENGSISPLIAAEIDFGNVAEAHRMLEERRNIGKVVLTV